MKQRRTVLWFVCMLSFIMLLSFPLGSQNPASLMHIRCFPDEFAPASSAEYYVNNNSSDIDLSPDKGAHSAFPNQQAGPDSIHDTLTEVGTFAQGTNVEDFVDLQTNLHDPGDKGSHSAFTNLQAKDGTADNLTEENQLPPATITVGLTTTNDQDAGSFSFSHDGQSGTDRLLIVRIMTDNGIDISGTPTYGGDSFTLLDNTVHSSGKPRLIIYYLVNPKTGTNTLSGNFASSDKFTVAATNVRGVDTVDPISNELIEQGKTPTGSPSNRFVDIDVTSESGDLVMDAFVYFDTPLTVGAGQSSQYNREIGGSGVSGHYGSGSSESGATSVNMRWEGLGEDKEYVMEAFNINVGLDDDYELDLEVGWTNTDFDETYEQLCVFPLTGGGWPDEDIKVDVWNGAWTSLLSDLTPDQWNNVSISSYLTDETFEIRFLGGSEDLDVTQDTWEIDAALLHVWSDDTTNYELDLEVQWTGLPTGETNEELCIYTGALGSENITVDVWNGTGWDNLFSSLNPGSWNNITVKAWLTLPTLTIRFKGGTDVGDTTQSSWNIDATSVHLYNNVPENSQQPSVSNLDDGTYMYARLREYEVTMYTLDADGFSNIKLMRLSLYSNDRSTSYWTLEYNEDSNSFSEFSDTSDYVTLNAAGSTATRSGDHVNATFRVAISWNHPDVSDVDARCFVVDASNENSTDWYEVNWDVETRLQTNALDVDDKLGTADRGDPDGLFYTTGAVAYLGSSLPPLSSEVDVWVKAVNTTEYGTIVGPWSDAALDSGQFNITSFADDQVGLVTYNVTVVEEGAGAGGTDLLQSPAQVTYIADRIEFYDSGSDDGRVDYGTVGKTWWRARYEYDKTEISAGLVAALTGPKALSWNGTHWTFQETVSSVTRIDYSVISASESTHGLTEWNQATPDVAIIWDRIEILTTTADDSRVSVGDNAELRVTARLEYGGLPLGAGDRLYIDDSPMAWDVGDSRFEFSVTQSTVGVWTYFVNSTGALEATYGITVVNLNLNSVDVIWDRVIVVSYDVDDDRVNIDESVPVNTTLQYEYDSAFVTFGPVTMNGGSCIYVGSGVWQHSHVESSWTSLTFDTIATSGNDYGITVVNQNSQSVVVVWDSLTVSISVVDSRIDVGTSASINASAVYDSTGLNYDGDLALDNTVFTHNTVGEWSYTVASAANDSHGITAISTNPVVSIIWDRLVVTGYVATDHRCDVSTMQSIYVTVEYDFDNVPFTDSFGSVSLNGELMTWESGPGQWSKSYLYNLPTIISFSVSSITDTHYDLTVVSDPEGSTEIVWDSLIVTIDVDDSRINVEENASITVSAVYEYDGTPYDGNLILNDTVTQYFTADKRGYTVASATGDSYGITLISVNSETFVIWDSLEIDITVANWRIDVGAMASITVSATYSFDSAAFDGVLTLNETTMQLLSLGRLAYTVSLASSDTYGITFIEENDVEFVIWDRLEVYWSETESERVAVGANVEVRFKVRYEYNGDLYTSINGELQVSDLDGAYRDVGNYWYLTVSKDTVGAFAYEVTGFSDSTSALTILMNASAYSTIAVFDAVYVEGAGVWDYPASFALSDPIEARGREIVTLYFYLKYQSDDSDVAGFGTVVKVNEVPASYIAARGRWEINVTSAVAGTVDYEIDYFADSFGITQINQGQYVLGIEWRPPEVSGSPMELVLVGMPWIALVTVGALGRRAFKKKTARRKLELMVYESRFDDANNINGFFVIHRFNGLPVYSRVIKGDLEEGLISGFITAISAFKSEFQEEEQLWTAIPISDIITAVQTEVLICAILTTGAPSSRQVASLEAAGRAVGITLDQEGERLTHVSRSVEAAEDYERTFDQIFSEYLDGRLLDTYAGIEMEHLSGKHRPLVRSMSEIEVDGGVKPSDLVKTMILSGTNELTAYSLVVEAIEQGLLTRSEEDSHFVPAPLGTPEGSEEGVPSDDEEASESTE